VTSAGLSYPASSTSVIDIARSVEASSASSQYITVTPQDGGAVVVNSMAFSTSNLYQSALLANYKPYLGVRGLLYPLLFKDSQSQPLFLYGGLSQVSPVADSNDGYNSSTPVFAATDKELEYAKYARSLNGAPAQPIGPTAKTARVSSRAINAAMEQSVRGQPKVAALPAHSEGYELVSSCEVGVGDGYHVGLFTGGVAYSNPIPEGRSRILYNGGGYKHSPFNIYAVPLVKHLRVRAITNPQFTGGPEPLYMQIMFATKVAGYTKTSGVLDNEWQSELSKVQYNVDEFSDPWCTSGTKVSTYLAQHVSKPPLHGDYSAFQAGFSIPTAVLFGIDNYFAVTIDVPVSVSDVSLVSGVYVDVKGSGHWTSAVFVLEFSLDGTDWYPVHAMDYAQFNADIATEAQNSSSSSSSYSDPTTTTTTTTASGTTYPSYYNGDVWTMTKQDVASPNLLVFRGGIV